MHAPMQMGLWSMTQDQNEKRKNEEKESKEEILGYNGQHCTRWRGQGVTCAPQSGYGSTPLLG